MTPLCVGFFALEGETTCAHRCADAAALGVAGSVACDMTAGASGGAVAALTFAQIRGITPQPFSDWYAIVSPTAPPTAGTNRMAHRYGVRNPSDPRGAVWNSIPTVLNSSPQSSPRHILMSCYCPLRNRTLAWCGTRAPKPATRRRAASPSL